MDWGLPTTGPGALCLDPHPVWATGTPSKTQRGAMRYPQKTHTMGSDENTPS